MDDRSKTVARGRVGDGNDSRGRRSGAGSTAFPLPRFSPPSSSATVKRRELMIAAVGAATSHLPPPRVFPVRLDSSFSSARPSLLPSRSASLLSRSAPPVSSCAGSSPPRLLSMNDSSRPGLVLTGLTWPWLARPWLASLLAYRLG